VAETIGGGLVGDVPPTVDYWKKIRSICNKYNIHLILDEVWCGTGVSGKTFCFDWDLITPDFVFISKTLAAGYGALSAVITTDKIGNNISNKSGQIFYSNTHQGYSLSVAAALKVQEIIQNKDFLRRVNDKGVHLRKTIKEELKNHEFFRDVRGRGLRNSFEYRCENDNLFGKHLKAEMFKKKILIDAKWHRVCFPLSLKISHKELNNNLEIFFHIFKETAKKWPKLKKRKIEELFF